MSCVHRWRIAEAQAQVSRGVCGLCGDERDFKNWFDGIEYYEDFSLAGSHRQRPNRAQRGKPA